jgi:NAD(P)-dependent dehydrogenase (short-subunit alcohol dehydrogenase family)
MRATDGVAGRVAVVTGAARGIGLEIASRLHADGAVVVLADLDAEGVSAAAGALGTRAAWSAGDVADDTYAQALVDRVIGDHGGLDVLVNNAAVAFPRLAGDLGADAFRRTLDVNLTAPFVLAVSVAEAMRREGTGGRIVNVASIAGKRISVHGGAAYTASKAGLIALTRHLAFEYAPDDITVNAVCPGGVDSPAFRRLVAARGEKKRLAAIPIGRFLAAKEIAHAVAFLVSDEAAAITGVALDVDGGSSLGWEPVFEYRAWMHAAGEAITTDTRRDR